MFEALKLLGRVRRLLPLLDEISVKPCTEGWHARICMKVNVKPPAVQFMYVEKTIRKGFEDQDLGELKGALTNMIEILEMTL